MPFSPKCSLALLALAPPKVAWFLLVHVAAFGHPTRDHGRDLHIRYQPMKKNMRMRAHTCLSRNDLSKSTLFAALPVEVVLMESPEHDEK